MKKPHIPENFKIGSPFIITAAPSQWSSALSKNCPIYLDHNDVKYPYHGEIIDIKYFSETHHIAMTDGYYGWSMTTLINENKITNIKELRKEKLKKINENR